MTAPLMLFAVCPVPICTNPVDDGEPCAECSALLGEGLTRRPCGCRTDVTVFGHESYCHQARICAAAVMAGED
jgi:hypothetical protein